MLRSSLDGLLTEYSDGSAVLPYQTLEEAQAENATRLKGMLSDTSVANLRTLSSTEFFDFKAEPTDTTQGDLFTIYGINHNIIIDGYLFTEESVNLSRKGALDGINVMLGGTTNEASAWGAALPFTLGVFYPITKDTFADSLRDAFGAGGETFSIGNETYCNTLAADSYHVTTDEEAFPAFQKAYSDSILMRYIVSATYLNNPMHDSSNVYVYSFNHQPPLEESFSDAATYHGCDTWYCLNSLRDGQKEWTDSDYQLAETLSSYTANFVKTGNPNGKGLPIWNTCSVQNAASFMYFDNGTGMMRCHTNNIASDIGFKTAYLKKIIQ